MLVAIDSFLACDCKSRANELPDLRSCFKSLSLAAYLSLLQTSWLNCIHCVLPTCSTVCAKQLQCSCVRYNVMFKCCCSTTSATEHDVLLCLAAAACSSCMFAMVAHSSTDYFGCLEMHVSPSLELLIYHNVHTRIQSRVGAHQDGVHACMAAAAAARTHHQPRVSRSYHSCLCNRAV